MGKRSPDAGCLERLAHKSIEGQLREILERGLNCSPFEAQGVVDAVQEVYGPYLVQTPEQAPPGTLTLVAVDADEPAGKAVKDCATRQVSLTVHRGAPDDALLRTQGPTAWRRSRLPDLCQQALAQGALLTREDLAYRVFYVSPRTVSRDLAHLRRHLPDTPVPLRSTVHDLGPVLTHRVRIVTLGLEGLSVGAIARRTAHSPAAVEQYLNTFIRCAHLAQDGKDAPEIAFVLHRSPALITRYLALLAECRTRPAYQRRLALWLDVGRGGGEKDGGPARG